MLHTKTAASKDSAYQQHSSPTDEHAEPVLPLSVCRGLHDAYFAHYGFVRHHISSMNKFLESDLPQIVRELPVKTIIHPDKLTMTKIRACNVFVDLPMIYEQDGSARATTPIATSLRAMTYENNIYVDLWVSTYQRESTTSNEWRTVKIHALKRIRPGAIPCMIGSASCAFAHHPPAHASAAVEFNGRFCVNGIQRVIVLSKKPAQNVIMTTIRSNSDIQCEFRARAQRRYRSTSTFVIKLLTRGIAHIVVNLPYVIRSRTSGASSVAPTALKYVDVPITALGAALGFTSRKHFAHAIATNGLWLSSKPICPQLMTPETRSIVLYVDALLRADTNHKTSKSFFHLSFREIATFRELSAFLEQRQQQQQHANQTPVPQTLSADDTNVPSRSRRVRDRETGAAARTAKRQKQTDTASRLQQVQSQPAVGVESSSSREVPVAQESGAMFVCQGESWSYDRATQYCHSIQQKLAEQMKAALRWISVETGVAKSSPAERELHIANLLATELFPQQGTVNAEEIVRSKRRILCMMLWRMIRIFTARSDVDSHAAAGARYDSMDDLGMQQFTCVGSLFAVRIRQLLTDMMNNVASSFTETYRLPENPQQFIRQRKSNTQSLSEAMRFAMATGDFNVSRSTNSSQSFGASLTLSDQSLQGVLGNLRRINVPLNKQSNVVEARLVPAETQFGFICSSATSEGKNVGLLLELAQSSQIAMGADVELLVEYPLRFSVEMCPGRTLFLTHTSQHDLHSFILPRVHDLRAQIAQGGANSASTSTNTALLTLCAEAETELAFIQDELRRWKEVRQGGVLDMHSFGFEECVERYWSYRRSGWVLVNGVLLGFVRDMYAAAKELRQMRRDSCLPKHTSVWVDAQNECLVLSCAQGEIRRPVIAATATAADADLDPAQLEATSSCAQLSSKSVDGLRASFQKIQALWHEIGFRKNEFWKRCEMMGLIEWIGPNEQKNARVRTSPDMVTLHRKSNSIWQEFTHCNPWKTVHQSTTMSFVPLNNHNQSPRNTYQGAMARAAQGRTTSYLQPRSEYILESGHRPIARTAMSEATGACDMPAGQLFMVAIMCMEGVVEDAIILNQAAADRGLGRGYLRTVLTEHISRRPARSDYTKFEKPDDTCVGLRPCDYSKLGKDGMPMVGAHVTQDDMVLGIVTHAKSTANKQVTVRVDKSTNAKLSKGEVARVEAVGMTRDAVRSTAHVFLRRSLLLERGSKISSQHAQKGVIGHVLPQADMPFTADGVTPDIIMNAHGMHSRMTIGQLLEMLMNTIGALRGQTIDATPFVNPEELAAALGLEDVSIESLGHNKVVRILGEALAKHGLDRLGTHEMYCGITGEKLEGRVFMGPSFYQMLRQVVLSKHHSRTKGPTMPLTQQPSEGRVHDGGLRLGEMEKDVLQSYGASELLLDRQRDNCDRIVTIVCNRCGLLAEPARDHNRLQQQTKRLFQDPATTGGESSSGLLAFSELDTQHRNLVGGMAHQAAAPFCRNCNTGDHCVNVLSRTAWRVTLQECMGMGIAPRARCNTELIDVSAEPAAGVRVAADGRITSQDRRRAEQLEIAQRKLFEQTTANTH